MLAIAGGKGGCGKTTTTLGLAAALARRRRSVLVVDADRDMPDLHALAGVARAPGLARLGDDTFEEVTHPIPTRSGVAVLPSSPGSTVRDLRTALDRLRVRSRSVLIDCPAGVGRAAVAPLRTARRVLLVTTLRSRSLRDTAKTAAMARELGTPIVGAVVTKVESGTDDRAAARAGRVLDCPVVATVPRAAAASGQAVLRDSAVTASYARLAEAINVPNS